MIKNIKFIMINPKHNTPIPNSVDISVVPGTVIYTDDAHVDIHNNMDVIMKRTFVMDDRAFSS